MEETADYYEQIPQYTQIIDGARGTLIHNSADETWMSIAYCYNPAHPLESAMWSNYYLATHMGIHDSFLKAVREELHVVANQQYLRYWHGAAGIIRLCHVFWNIRKIFVILAVAVTTLTAILFAMLWKIGFRAEAMCFLLSLTMISVWAVPFCLEYVWVFLIMLMASILAVRLVKKSLTKDLGMLFLISGMMTVYLDFLSAETLTLLIPLLLVLRVSREEAYKSDCLWLASTKLMILWSIGYLGAWAMKWVIASVVLGENVMPLVQSHISQRIGGSVSLPLSEFLFQAVLRNIRSLFPFDYGVVGAGIMLFLVIFIVWPVYKNKVHVREDVNLSRVTLYIIIGLIPYIRFLVLHNHSYIHSFFTYRAQAATVLALCFIILELVEPTFTHRKAVKIHGSDNPHALSK